MRLLPPLAIAALAGLPLSALSAGGALAASAIQKECAAKYQAAKSANALNGQTYNQYYKQCAAEAKAAKSTPAAPAPAAPAPAPAPSPAANAPTAPAAPPPTTARAPAAPAAAGAAVFPAAISPQYQSLSAGKARFKTCDDQYKINKTSNANGGLKWIMKGGGYYSECNKHLKGA